ncbi:glutaconate CoA-transferase, subunit A [Patescibacteria group bacterium]|nr:glutaconate CoA-transferase, subunit A [Patescibacteria group bacterium]
MYTDTDKRCGLDELIAQIKSGDCLAIGGGLSWREPMAALRALIRHGIDDLTVVGSAHGIDVDLLCAAGAVSVSSESYVGFEQDFGLALNFRRVCESGKVEAKDNCCYTLVQQLRAAIMGLPFMPIRSMQGTDFLKLHPEFKTMICPFTGETLVLVPALSPNVALLHAQYADKHGNICIQGAPVADVLFAKAAKKTLVTVEKIIPHAELIEQGITIPYFYVAAVCELPYGAHPTSCYPLYAYDRQHTEHYYQAAKQGTEVFQTDYLTPYVYNCSRHQDYLNRIGTEHLELLKTWQHSNEAWLNLYE